MGRIPNRLASRRQRLWLFALAEGKCQLCGKELPESFHCDHIQEYSKGGQTLLHNMRAVCATCNLTRKRSSR